MANSKPLTIKDFPVHLPEENYEFIKKMKAELDKKQQ